MNKILNVPDELVKDIKILAAMKDKSVKKYLEDIVTEVVKY